MVAKPQIVCLANGPYSFVSAGTASLRRPAGDALPDAPKISLCRCGGSRNKPFCDGTHRTNGFRDENRADPAGNKREAYAGKGITIFDNRTLCAHAGVCTDQLAAVFRYGKEPWVDPDGAAVQKVIDTIRKCPSGALSYAVGGKEAEPPQRAPMVTVTNDGPYAVTGGIELLGVKMGEGASKEHYTLCRCGASKNKPFCDGSHWNVKFKDP